MNHRGTEKEEKYKEERLIKKRTNSPRLFLLLVFLFVSVLLW
jgi:hypothetical protein